MASATARAKPSIVNSTMRKGDTLFVVVSARTCDGTRRVGRAQLQNNRYGLIRSDRDTRSKDRPKGIIW